MTCITGLESHSIGTTATPRQLLHPVYSDRRVNRFGLQVSIVPLVPLNAVFRNALYGRMIAPLKYFLVFPQALRRYHHQREKLSQSIFARSVQDTVQK